MREYCLVSKSGTVINMCLTGNPEGPALDEYQIERGYTWVPVEKVSDFNLRQYRYWTERP